VSPSDSDLSLSESTKFYIDL